MATARPPQGAQAALRALRLLKLFSAAAPEMNLAEISERAGLNKTTTHRLLQALSSEAMIERDETTSRYRLGAGLMALGVQALASSDLRLRARPMLKRLARETGETATLEVPIDRSMLILDEVASSHFVGAAGNVGTRWPLHATSTGKALIAFDEQVMTRLGDELPALTPSTIVCRADLEKQLGLIRRRGFAGYIRLYLRPSPFMLPFNVIGEISRTLALAVRLFGNIMSGAMIGAILLTVVPFIFPVVMNLLGLITGVIQAYIFAVLAAVYIAAAVKVEAGREGQPTSTEGEEHG